MEVSGHCKAPGREISTVWTERQARPRDGMDVLEERNILPLPVFGPQIIQLVSYSLGYVGSSPLLFSFHNLSCDRIIISSEANSPQIATSFIFQYPPVFSRSSSSCLHLIPRLHATHNPPFTFPVVTTIRTKFLCSTWTIKLAFLLLLFVGNSFPVC